MLLKVIIPPFYIGLHSGRICLHPDKQLKSTVGRNIAEYVRLLFSELERARLIQSGYHLVYLRRNHYFGPAASIWFEIWWVVDPGQKNFDFIGKFQKNCNFFMQFHKEKKNRFF